MIEEDIPLSTLEKLNYDFLEEYLKRKLTWSICKAGLEMYP